jgi:hypothetical protein
MNEWVKTVIPLFLIAAILPFILMSLEDAFLPVPIVSGLSLWLTLLAFFPAIRYYYRRKETKFPAAEGITFQGYVVQATIMAVGVVVFHSLF